MTKEKEEPSVLGLVQETLQRRKAQRAAQESVSRQTAAVRLSNVENELREIKQRVNQLLWVIAGAAVTQIVLHLLGK